MQPLGRKSKRFPSKIDHHIRPKRFWANWWESICNADKKAARQKEKKDILDEL